MPTVCLPNTKKLGEKILEWVEKPFVKKTFTSPADAALRMVENEFLISLSELSGRNVDITKGQLSSFESRLKELNNNIADGSIGNKFATFFWQSSHFGKKDPVIGAILRNMQMSNFHFRRHEAADKRLMQGLLDNLEKEAISLGIISKTSMKFKQAQRQMQKLNDEWMQARVDYENGDIAIDKVSEISGKIDNLVARTYLQVYDKLQKVIETQIPQLEKQKFQHSTEKEKKEYREGKRVIRLTKNELLQLKDTNGNPLSAEMHKAVLSYTDLMAGLYDRLRLGVDARIDSILGRMSRDNDSLNIDKLNSIRKKLQGKLMPKYEGGGFFPHYTRDLSVDLMSGLMPFFDEIHSGANQYLKGKNTRTITSIIDGMDNYISGHTKRRAETGKYEQSKNFLNTMTNYISDVNRFNYAAHMDKHMFEGLRSIENIYKLDGSAHGYGQSVVEYIYDLHQATNGDMNISPKTRALMRTVLGMEFISKLGINPRGAARNWTQRLLDYVEWGPVQVWRTKKILDSLNLSESVIEAELKKVGLLFEDTSPQLIESELQTSAFQNKGVEFDETTQKHVFTKKSTIEKVADTVGWAAGKSSFLHRKAENSNRKQTFKIAFAQMYDWLDNPRYKQQLLTKNSKLTDAQVNSKIRFKARQYAVNMVVLNHFDYAQYAKSKMLRSKVGRFLGQFQHYSFEFFDRNMRIAREAKHDLMTGNIIPGQNAQGLSKAYRMALIYFMAPAVAAAITGLEFGIIEHDSHVRLNQLAVALTGDEDEIQEAFYGKGPIISTFGGPITSDLLDLGMMLDLVNLDADSYLTLIAGLEKYDPTIRSTDTTRKIRLINSFAGRVAERHIPQLLEGRIGWAFQQEFGFYHTAEAKEKQRKAKDIVQSIAPEGVVDLLEKMAEGKV